MESLCDLDTDIAFITESWLDDETSLTTSIIKSYGFKICHTYRTGRGGGVAILYRNFDCQTLSIPWYISSSISSFEYHIVKIKSLAFSYCAICIYRKQEIPVYLFLEEVEYLLDYVTHVSTDINVVLGDFNVHFDTKSKDARDVTDILSCYGLAPLIVDPTHKKGHTLDQVFINSNDIYDIPLQEKVHEHFSVSDHFAIEFRLPCKSYTANASKMITKRFRKLDQINIEDLRSTLLNNLEDNWFSNDHVDIPFSELYHSFKGSLQVSFDKHAPLFTKTVNSGNIAQTPPWFDEEYILARRKRRSLEREYKKSPSSESKALYAAQRDACVDLAKEKRESFCKTSIKDCKGNQGSLFKTIPKLLDTKHPKVLPKHLGSDKQLADDFNNFFVEKMSKIRSSIAASTSSKTTFPPTIQNSQSTELTEFRPSTTEEIADIINKMTIKTSPADPIPASVYKHLVNDLIPHYTILVNKSLSTGSVEGIKESVISPLIKKFKLDHDANKSYRPISNIEFISKIIEKVVLIRLNEHMNINNLHTPEQFAYKKRHSTEHLVLQVVDEVLVGFEKGSATIVILLDLSAAFDTVNLTKLMQILENQINIKGTALNWFKSFLFGRTQKVMIGSSFSEVLEVLFGVPQGSVLGPVLFNIYMRNLPKYIESHCFLTSCYADDSNARLQFSLNFQYFNISQRVPNLLQNIGTWMNEHFLKINPDKTEVILFAPNHSSKIGGLFLNDQTCLRFSSNVKLLGVNLDESLNFNNHVNEVVSSSYFHIRTIGKMKAYMSKDDLESYVHSIISSKLDYCNVVLYGINKSVVNKLQKLQNAAARLIFKLPKHCSVTEKIRELHWLRVEERIVYKILLFVYKFFTSNGPAFLDNILEIVDFETRLLSRKNLNTKYGRRSFRYVAPHLWNRLPAELRTLNSDALFKKKLKHNLFDNINNIMGSVDFYRT